MLFKKCISLSEVDFNKHLSSILAIVFPSILWLWIQFTWSIGKKSLIINDNKIDYCYEWRDSNTEEKRWIKIQLV